MRAKVPTYKGDAKSVRRLWTTGQIAHACGCCPRTVTKWVDSGKLKGFRLPHSKDRRIRPQDAADFLREHGMPVPRELMCGARVTYGLTMPAPVPGWDHCDAFQLGALCNTQPILAAVLGDEWGVAAALKAWDHIRANNPDAKVVFVLDPSNASASVPGEVRVRGEVDVGELLGAL